MRDECQTAILHVIAKRGDANAEEVLFELQQIYPKREIRRQMERLITEGALVFKGESVLLVEGEK